MEVPAEAERNDAEMAGREDREIRVAGAARSDDPMALSDGQNVPLFRRFFGQPRVPWAAAGLVVAFVWIAGGVARLIVDPTSAWSWVFCFLGVVQLLLYVPAFSVALQDKKRHRGFYDRGASARQAS